MGMLVGGSIGTALGRLNHSGFDPVAGSGEWRRLRRGLPPILTIESKKSFGIRRRPDHPVALVFAAPEPTVGWAAGLVSIVVQVVGRLTPMVKNGCVNAQRPIHSRFGPQFGFGWTL